MVFGFLNTGFSNQDEGFSSCLTPKNVFMHKTNHDGGTDVHGKIYVTHVNFTAL